MPPTPRSDTPRPTGPRWLLYAALALLILLHLDLWWWEAGGFVLGLPVALTYHVLYCLAAAGLMVLFVRFAWPEGLDQDLDDGPGEDGR